MMLSSTSCNNWQISTISLGSLQCELELRHETPWKTNTTSPLGLAGSGSMGSSHSSRMHWQGVTATKHFPIYFCNQKALLASFKTGYLAHCEQNKGKQESNGKQWTIEHMYMHQCTKPFRKYQRWKMLKTHQAPYSKTLALGSWLL